MSTTTRAWRWSLFVLLVVVKQGASSNRLEEWSMDLPPMDAGSMDLMPLTSSSSSSLLKSKPFQLYPFSQTATITTKRPHSSSKRGKLSIEMQGTSFSATILPPPSSLTNQHLHDETSEVFLPTVTQNTQVTLSTDPASTMRLVFILLRLPFFGGAAFMGTLRILAPLIVARRTLNAFGDLVLDYLRGRYLRKTYSRVERMYVRYYELPAVFRALCRTLAQVTILFLLSRIMGWMVGIHHAPCRNEPVMGGIGTCRWWCGLLWIFAVVGTGHACSTAVAVWGGPLRIQVAASHLHTGRSMAARVFTRPWHILQWMQDPEQWITMISATQTSMPQPFDPNPILFPATWVPLRLLQMLAVAKAASSSVPSRSTWYSSRDPVRVIMRRFLIQLALADEWDRVFLGEKRVGLGVAVAFVYLTSAITLTVKAAFMDTVAAIMFLPSLLAISVSLWMNVVIFWNRLAARRRQAAISAFHERKEAALRAIKWEYPRT